RRPPSGALRQSAAPPPTATASAVVPSSAAASSDRARAWPISFCAIDEKATSSSSSGAMPVHSESRQPSISSSSASSRSSCARSLTRFLQLRLQGVAVDPVVVLAELVDEVGDLRDRVPLHDPKRLGLRPPPELLMGISAGEGEIRRV